MQSKGFNFIIGLFVVAGIASIFIIGLWLADTGSTEKVTPYQILFEESVSGLSVGSKVSYRGIRIGSVTSIGINPDDPQYVLVGIAIREGYPMHQGDIASLKMEGITGTSYIDIEGARLGSEIIVSTQENPAIIPSRRSELGRLVKGLPDLINEGTILAQRFSEMLNEENRDQVASILANINQISAELLQQSEKIDAVLVTLNEAGNEVIAASRSVEGSTAKFNTLVESMQVTSNDASRLITEDGTDLVNEWKSTAQSLTELSETAQNLIAANEESLEHFSQEGLYEFTLFLREARYLVAGLTRVVDKIEASGARFLLDQHKPEIDPN